MYVFICLSIFNQCTYQDYSLPFKTLTAVALIHCLLLNGAWQFYFLLIWFLAYFETKLRSVDNFSDDRQHPNVWPYLRLHSRHSALVTYTSTHFELSYSQAIFSIENCPILRSQNLVYLCLVYSIEAFHGSSCILE